MLGAAERGDKRHFFRSFASDWYRPIAENSCWCSPGDQKQSCLTHTPAGAYEHHRSEQRSLYRFLPFSIVGLRSPGTAAFCDANHE